MTTIIYVTICLNPSEHAGKSPRATAMTTLCVPYFQGNPNVQGTNMLQAMCFKCGNGGGQPVTSDKDNNNKAVAPQRNPCVRVTKMQYNVCTSFGNSCRQLALRALWASLGPLWSSTAIFQETGGVPKTYSKLFNFYYQI